MNDGAAAVRVGGQPRWVEAPQWPLSASLRTPMRFLAQVSTPEGRTAYAFLTDEDDPHDDSFLDDRQEPESGENAVIVQPDGDLPPWLDTVRIATGPTVRDEPVDAPAGSEPDWIQSPEAPPGGPWRFLAQVDDVDAAVGMGDAAVAYLFLRDDGLEGRLLIQSA